MRTENQYESLEGIPHIIDKTEFLEKGITAFPSVFVEGAAASGKTTAVNLLLSKHPETETVLFFMEEEKNQEFFAKRLQDLKEQMQERTIWAIFENLQSASMECVDEIAAFIEKAGGIEKSGSADKIQSVRNKSRAIFISRECPEPALLKLLWKRKMDLISMEELYFTNSEVQELIEKSGSTLNPNEVYEVTGGWAGCVDLMARFSGKKDNEKPDNGKDAAELRKCYEIDAYIKHEIIDTLSEEKQEIMRRAAVCPWIDQELCSEIWGIPWLGESLERLGRKGMLVRVGRTDRWKIAPLFRNNFQTGQTASLWKRLGNWYNSHHHIKEALYCLRQSQDEKAYKDCMLEHFGQVPFLEQDWSAVMQWKENDPRLCYLRGMYHFLSQDTEGLQREIRKVEKTDDNTGQKEEILLNLQFVNPEMPLESWLEFLKTLSAENKKYRLYNILGGSFSFLCGLRDLSGLFACAKKDENARAHLWKESLGDEEWQAFCQAKLIYYLETGRWDALKDEEKALLEQWCVAESWQIRLGCFYVLCKLRGGPENMERIRLLEDSLLRESSSLCVRNTEAVRALAFNGSAEREKLARRLKYINPALAPDINEINYSVYCSYARGYMLLNQYEKASRVLRRMIPYLHRFKRSRLLAEMLFLQALVSWEKNMHGQALRAVIESFVISSTYRYMQFYLSYGKKGHEVLEAYVQWLKSNSPEGWHRKKKYNYGNILRMPFEDYIEMILRKSGQGARYDTGLSEKDKEERLTMTETIILQDIGMGLSNNAICESLNLKLPTVKNHIYSIYRKLGVNSRVQAVLRGKELGILD